MQYSSSDRSRRRSLVGHSEYGSRSRRRGWMRNALPPTMMASEGDK
jgi:hypothetical protein